MKPVIDMRRFDAKKKENKKRGFFFPTLKSFPLALQIALYLGLSLLLESRLLLSLHSLFSSMRLMGSLNRLGVLRACSVRWISSARPSNRTSSLCRWSWLRWKAALQVPRTRRSISTVRHKRILLRTRLRSGSPTLITPFSFYKSLWGSCNDPIFASQAASLNALRFSSIPFVHYEAMIVWWLHLRRQYLFEWLCCCISKFSTEIDSAEVVIY
jgi:hypothetical protein